MASQTMLYQEYHEIVQMPNKDIGINAFSYDCCRAPSAGVFPLHWHECLEIIYVEKGWIEVEIDRTRLHIAGGEMAVVNPRQLHICDRFDPATTLYCLIIDMNVMRGRYVDSSDEHYILPLLEGKILIDGKIDGRQGLGDLIRSAVDLFTERGIAYQLRLKSIVFEILFRQFAQHSSVRQVDPRRLPTSVPRERVNAMLEYVNQHYAESIQLNDFVEVLHINKHYICKLFRQYTGKTVLKYVNEMRVRKAEEMLLSSDRSVTEIAYATGFPDFNYFSRIFKQVMGVTPSQLRKKYRNA